MARFIKVKTLSLGDRLINIDNVTDIGVHWSGAPNPVPDGSVICLVDETTIEVAHSLAEMEEILASRGVLL